MCVPYFCKALQRYNIFPKWQRKSFILIRKIRRKKEKNFGVKQGLYQGSFELKKYRKTYQNQMLNLTSPTQVSDDKVMIGR